MTACNHKRIAVFNTDDFFPSWFTVTTFLI
jgi:hypothetical protein